MSLDSLVLGAGAALVEAVRRTARDRGCTRLWLVTTNDNLCAQRFYPRVGFTLTAVHLRALDVSRRLKPDIPQLGQGGVERRDELEFEDASLASE